MNNNPEIQKINRLASHLFRENSGKMVACLVKKFGYYEIDNASDAVQEAFETALIRWKFSGIPDKPFNWLLKVSINKMINKINRFNNHKNKIQKLLHSEQWVHEIDDNDIQDGQFSLLVFFSLIDLTERNKIVITLYFLCGFGYAEISNALLLKIEAVKKIISRSKENIKTFAEKFGSFQVKPVDVQPEHLLKIIYLMFNEGYKVTKKPEGINNDLCYEAIRLGKLILEYHPDNKVYSLLALMFFNVSRFPARIDGERKWIPIKDQNRSLWNKELIAEGFYYLNKAKGGQINKYYLEALISSIHSSTPAHNLTDWKKITFLYSELEKVEPGSITIKLNRIISESNINEIRPLIKELDLLEESIPEETKFTFYSCKAYLYSKIEEWETSLAFYKESYNYAKNKIDKGFILSKINETEAKLQNGDFGFSLPPPKEFFE